MNVKDNKNMINKSTTVSIHLFIYINICEVLWPDKLSFIQLVCWNVEGIKH
jgi:hypothetical protein